MVLYEAIRNSAETGKMVEIKYRRYDMKKDDWIDGYGWLFVLLE